MQVKVVQILCKSSALVFFAMAGGYYIYSHYVVGGTDCDAFQFFAPLQAGCLNTSLTWLVVVAIASPGAALWGWASKRSVS